MVLSLTLFPPSRNKRISWRGPPDQKIISSIVHNTEININLKSHQLQTIYQRKLPKVTNRNPEDLPKYGHFCRKLKVSPKFLISLRRYCPQAFQHLSNSSTDKLSNFNVLTQLSASSSGAKSIIF